MSKPVRKPRSLANDPAATRVGYARVSTNEQDAALQHDALRAAGCGAIFTDTASGAKTERPELARALASVKAGDTLVVWKLDRLGRSLPQLIAIVTELAERGVAFCSLTEQLDTASAGGRLIFHIFGALAEFERALIRERTFAGLSAARERGAKSGRRPVVDEAKLAKARALIGQGLRVTEAAGRLKISKSALYQALKLPA